MAVTGTRAMRDRHHGLTPCLAGGRVTAALGILATVVEETINVRDQDVNENMAILATVRSSPDTGIMLVSALPGDRTIAFKVINAHSGSSDAGDIIIDYIGV